MNWHKFVAALLTAASILAADLSCTQGKIESIGKTMPVLEGPEYLDALFHIYDHSVKPGSPEIELAALNRYLDEAVRQNNEAETGYAMLRRLCTFHDYGMVDSVLHYSPESMAFLGRCGHWAGYYYAALLQVESFIRLNRTILAMNSARRLYREARNHDDDYGKGATAYILGDVHYKKGDHNQARQYMVEAIEYLEDAEDPTMLFNAYDRMWAIYSDTGAYRAALDVLGRWEKRLEQHFAESENNKHISGSDTRFYLWCGMARVYANLKMFPEARRYISMAGKETDGKPLCMNYLCLVESAYFEELGDYQSAIDWFRRTIPENWDYPVSSAGYEAASTFAALLTAGGRHREASEVYRRALRFADQIQAAEIDEQLHELQNLYRFDRMEGHAHNMKVIGSIVIFALMSVFTIYFVYANRLKNKNRALSEQLREVSRLRLWRQEHIALARSSAGDADAKAANGGSNGNGVVVVGRKNENIVWLACRKMSEEKLFCDPALNRKQLADMLGTNENYLASAIRDVNEGQTVGDFINGFRLDYACYLITEFPQMKLETIAQESGFMTRSTLFRLFHKKFGMSPSQYRIEQMKERKAV